MSISARFFSCVLPVLLLALTGCDNGYPKAELKSPDGRTVLTVEEIDGTIFYSVIKNDSIVLEPSATGFVIDEGEMLNSGFRIKNMARTSFNDTWEQPWGESRFVHNNYNELVVYLQQPEGNKRKMNMYFRVFDDGFGFRYEFPRQDGLQDFRIMEELTEFRFPATHNAWWIPQYKEHYYESIARFTPINQMDTVHTPLTIEALDGRFLAIHEANLTDYAKMNLFATDDKTLRVDLVPWSDGVKVYAEAPFVTPWRYMIIGNRPGDLVTSHIMLNLNEPSKLPDEPWITPGKYIGIWWALHLDQYTWYSGPRHGATTELTKHYIDFAAENGFMGVLVEGWNEGWDGNWMQHGHTLDFTKPYPDFDIKEITDYAREKGVQLIGHHETAAQTINYERQLDEAFGFYRKYGVHNVKTGYVNEQLDFKEAHDGQYGVRHYRKVIETAARYQICINNHEPVMPTGLSRTWPNLMTQEGVRGQEHDAWSEDGGNPPSHTTVVPFLRGLAGPMDFTFGTFNFENKAYPFARVQTTIAKQLALYVVIYSPLQMASDTPENYADNKAFDFIRDVPADWYETSVVDAVIGEYCVFARRDRNSEEWFVGAITNDNTREIEIELSFLDHGRKYLAQIYSDGEDADWRTNPTSFSYDENEAGKEDKLTVRLASGGGCAIRFIPER